MGTDIHMFGSTTFKRGVPMVYAWGFARKLGCTLQGRVISGQLRVVMVRVPTR